MKYFFPDEEVDGQDFLDLTLDVLQNTMKLKFGPASKVMRVVKQFKSSVWEKESNPRVPTSAGDSNHSCDLSVRNHVHESSVTKDAASTVPESIHPDEANKPPKKRSLKRLFDTDSLRFSRFGTVRDTLVMYKAEEIIEKALARPLSDSDRQELVNILVAEMKEVYGSYYPPTDMKVAAARAIVTEFPKMYDPCENLGFRYLYDPDTGNGFIAFRFWNIRKLLPDHEKKNGGKKTKMSDSPQCIESDDLLSAEELKSKVDRMKFMSPETEKQDAITLLLRETHNDRRKWVLDFGPSVREIHDEYPRLWDYDGEMMQKEFRYIFQDKDEKFTKFPDLYCKKILAYVKNSRKFIYDLLEDITDGNLRALLCLMEILSVCNSAKNVQKSVIVRRQNSGTKNKKKTAEKLGKKKVPENNEHDENGRQGGEKDDSSDADRSGESKVKELQYHSKKMERFIRIVPEGTSAVKFAKDVVKKSNKSIQPYIICVKGREKDTFFISCDGFLINGHDRHSFAVTVDLLFKIFYVFNLHYPTGLQNFYGFMEKYIYDFDKKELPSSVASCHIAILNTPITD
ncbi:hypothetical protein QAD02_010136 [Eretmocerus hayati]|uniref:Uncharacterized protein n=1 Tax=Eretmocerus hayati TaxID=131215 RepID=A0ACC2NBY9_9HYME|nr:hypothetical protein QAD02_010136 [Eretmocerus hayati]